VSKRCAVSDELSSGTAKSDRGFDAMIEQQLRICLGTVTSNIGDDVA
jgi:hypothetical protein